ncbi:MAG: DUF3343 domain-containing protein [Oscillospiraceae bacterium]|nr:DUF3343 domain-containing protein [Oscillospiraceae bacterium]
MKVCMITFRSVTPAQRAEGVLKKAGVRCSIHRTPKWMEEQGCGYSVRLHRRDVPAAVPLLEKEEIPFRKVYLLRETGKPEEMRL